MGDWYQEQAAEQDRRLGSAIEDLANHTRWIIIEHERDGRAVVLAMTHDDRAVSGRGTFVRDAVSELLARIEQKA